MITYEYPFNERIRTLLRLEDLFEKTAHFAQEDGALEHHAALVALFEILEVASRADLKMDLIQELERQRQTLLAFRNNPEISEERCPAHFTKSNSRRRPCLPAWQDRPVPARERLADEHQEAPPFPAGLRIRPAVLSLVVLHRPVDTRREALELDQADAAAARCGRHRAAPAALQRPAEELPGDPRQFQLNLGGSAAQMVRITVDRDEPAIPEVSANKYF